MDTTARNILRLLIAGCTIRIDSTPFAPEVSIDVLDANGDSENFIGTPGGAFAEAAEKMGGSDGDVDTVIADHAAENAEIDPECTRCGAIGPCDHYRSAVAPAVQP